MLLVDRGKDAGAAGAADEGASTGVGTFARSRRRPFAPVRSTRHASLLVTSATLGGHALDRRTDALMAGSGTGVLLAPIVVTSATGSSRRFYTYDVGQIFRGAGIGLVQAFLAGHAGQPARVGR